MMNNLPLRMVAVAVVVGSITCGCQKRSTALTYNLGLTPGVKGYKERRSAVVQSVHSQGREVDFMCLQEAWFEKDMKDVLDMLGDDFPYHYSPIHKDIGQLRDNSGSEEAEDEASTEENLTGPHQVCSAFVWNHYHSCHEWTWLPTRWRTLPCRLSNLLRLLTCYGWRCLVSEAHQGCVMEHCEAQMYALSDSCRSCVSMASSGASDVLGKCGNVLEKFNRVNPPGLLVLSKEPLADVEYVNYHHGDKVLVERGYIKAQVQGGLTFVCTHLTAMIPQYYDVGLKKFNSYEEMQADEIRQLNATFFASPHILLGDLNMGPQRNNRDFPYLQSESAENYDTLIGTLGYKNPYLQTDGRCTYCQSNDLVLWAAVEPPHDDVILDHVLTSSGLSAEVTSAKRVFDQKDVWLSDHYGIQVDVCVP
ncbi:uncharacterized protein LOC143287536 [Babylonia areolata]|uniref:uncharacterized protein LOC143287536 n=1 Tax=Babylonia areolata TaxID=304850 RepID=UPI003FD1D638